MSLTGGKWDVTVLFVLRSTPGLSDVVMGSPRSRTPGYPAPEESRDERGEWVRCEGRLLLE